MLGEGLRVRWASIMGNDGLRVGYHCVDGVLEQIIGHFGLLRTRLVVVEPVSRRVVPVISPAFPFGQLQIPMQGYPFHRCIGTLVVSRHNESGDGLASRSRRLGYKSRIC